MKIRTYLLFWFLAVLAVTGVIFTWFELTTYRSIKNAMISEEAKKIDSSFKSSIEEIVGDFSGSLPVYVYRISTKEKSPQSILEKVKAQYASDWSFVIMDGKCYVYPEVEACSEKYRSEPWYISSLNSPSRVVENEFNSAVFHSNVFTVSVALGGNPHVVGGVIFKESRFFSMVTAQMAGNSFVIFKGKKVIYPHGLRVNLQKEDQLVTLNGVEYLLYYSDYDSLMKKVGISSSTGYKIAFLIPYAPISSRLKNSAGYVLLFFSILVFIVMGAFLFSTSKISSAIVALEEMAAAFDMEELILHEKQSNEKKIRYFKETSQIFEKLSEMFQDISAHVEELRATNDELESSYEDIENLSNSLAVESSRLRELSESSKLIATASDVNEAASILLDKIINVYGCDGVVLLDIISGDMKVVQRQGIKFEVPTLSPLKEDLMSGKAATFSKNGKHYYVAPILFGSKPIAMIVMMFSGRVPDPEELEYINNFSTHFASVLNSNRMIEELKNSYIYLAEKFSEISEIYDYETGSHVKRVGKYSELIAKELGMSESFVEQIGIYAMIHDIGKLKVPREILMKNGPLTKTEFEEMKKHTIYGEKILGDAPFLEIARHIARFHHEKFDGSGYPDGLKGNEIPIEARIVAIADVYDALRSKRRYKKGYSHQEAFEIITVGDGRTLPQHFDPEVLRVFKKCHLEFSKIYDLLGE